jgi:hypothetical protein
MGLHLVAEGAIAVNGVVRPSAFPRACDDPGLLELAKDFQNGTFGDGDLLGDVPHAQIAVTRKADEHMGVIGQECPGDPIGAGRGLGHFSF